MTAHRPSSTELFFDVQRGASLTLAALSAMAVGLAAWLQYAWELRPCSLCIAQRYLFLLLGVVSLMHALSPRGGRLHWLGFCAQWAVLGTLALVAAKNVWVLVVPSPSCGRDKLADFLVGLPLAQWWPAMFEPTGMCSDPVPPLLGLPFPAWSAILAIGFMALLAAAWRHSRRLASPATK